MKLQWKIQKTCVLELNWDLANRLSLCEPFDDHLQSPKAMCIRLISGSGKDPLNAHLHRQYSLGFSAGCDQIQANIVLV